MKRAHCRICRGPHSRIVHRIQKLPASRLPKGHRWGRRRNPDASPGDTFRVVAHGKNGEVAYRGRELHSTYGSAWKEAQSVARRAGLTDVHVVKNGEAIVGEIKASVGPRRNPSASVSSHEAIRRAVRDASFEFSVGPLLLINPKVDPLGGLWVAKRGSRYEVWVPGDVSSTRYMASTPTAVADYAWGYLRGKPQTGTGPSVRRRNPTPIEWMKCGECNRRVRFTKNLASQRWVADWHRAVGGAGFCVGSRKPARESSRTNPFVPCERCSTGISEDEAEDGELYEYGNLCWECDFETHSGISDMDHDRSYGPPVFDGSWRRYDDRRALRAAYKRGTI